MMPGGRTLLFWLLVLACGWSGGLRAEVGADVVAAFARAARGEPLRYVAMGGSITEASGPGWIGDWLRELFPEALVTTVNSGMSGTGSSLGVFRVGRDLIAHQPDLVIVEFCVNDGGLPDEQAIRYMETLVVRLKSSPHPPAIVVVEAAARVGVNLERHRRVARHYGLLEVDMQAAVDARLTSSGETWGALFSDDVHPNRAGHAFYAETLRAALAPLVEHGREAAADGRRVASRPLPERLSSRPLLLDARMAPLHAHVAPGWRAGGAPPAGWGRHFQGTLVADEPGATLLVPVRGSAVGLFHALHEGQGDFFVNVNGGPPRHVAANTRDGFSSVNVDVDMPAREHVLAVVVPERAVAGGERGRRVTLGHLLIAGESLATGESSPQGAFTAEKLRGLEFVFTPARQWRWAGPFASARGSGPAQADARADTHTRFLPEPGDADFEVSRFDWRPVAGEGSLVDFKAVIGTKATGPVFAYARTSIDGGAGGDALVSLNVDYYCQLWINGERALVFDGPHSRPHLFVAKLRPGANGIFVKAGAGSAGHALELGVARLDR